MLALWLKPTSGLRTGVSHLGARFSSVNKSIALACCPCQLKLVPNPHLQPSRSSSTWKPFKQEKPRSRIPQTTATTNSAAPTPFNVRPPVLGRRRTAELAKKSAPPEQVEEETPDPSIEDVRAKRGKSKRKPPPPPEPGDAAHPSSVFFQSASSARPVPAAEEPQDSVNENEQLHRRQDQSKSATLSPSDILVYDPARFADATTFRELKVASHVHTKLPSRFNIHMPTPIQKHVIPFLMHAPFWTERVKGPQTNQHQTPQTEADRIGLERRRLAAKAPKPRDLIIQDMTGSGKTISWALPMLSLVDNFSKHTQGVVLAPTRELAVQFYRVLHKINDSSGSSGKTKRNRNPVRIELAVGKVTQEYADGLKYRRPHIIVSTPASLSALVLPPSSEPGKEGGFGVLQLHHVRMFVAEEIDHLLLPFSAGRVDRVIRAFVGTRSHASVRRQGRLVLVSAAISERVVKLANSWMHLPVTATSDGLMDGWIRGEKRLRDHYYLSRQEGDRMEATQQPEEESRWPQKAKEREIADRAASYTSKDADQVLSAEEDEDDGLGFDAAELDAADSASASSLKRADDDLIVDEDAQELARFDEMTQQEELNDFEDEEDEEAELEKNPNVVSAETFRLPGSDPVESAAVSLAIPPTGVPGGDAADNDANAAITLPLPSASISSSSVRFLPPTLNHVVVHVHPSRKLTWHNANAISDANSKKKAQEDRISLLTRLHSVLKPRVALVFFSNSKEAVELAEAITRKNMKAKLLVSNADLTVKQKIDALRSAAHGSVPFIFATDLASRGLDIEGLSHVINFDPPKTALDYVHRAGRVERLGGKTGCTVVNIVKDERVQLPVKQADPSSPNYREVKPKNPSTFIGPEVTRMRKILAQLHLDARHVIVKGGSFHPFVAPKLVRIQPEIMKMPSGIEQENQPKRENQESMETTAAVR